MSIDIAIFLGFFILNLVVGLFYSRGIKTIKSYAVGDGNFNVTTIAEGRGVGLSLCEKIIKTHKGTIKAESDGRNGSTFSFVLPL